MADLRDIITRQCGVISRRQVEAAGETAADIARRLRRREWVRLLPGVYVDHTGPPSCLQRAWAGVLYYEPAVVADESALRLAGTSDQVDRVVIAVDRRRNVRERDGYRVRWVTDLEATSLATSPPRMRVEDAALRVAAALASRAGRHPGPRERRAAAHLPGAAHGCGAGPASATAAALLAG